MGAKIYHDDKKINNKNVRKMSCYWLMMCVTVSSDDELFPVVGVVPDITLVIISSSTVLVDSSTA